MGHRENAVLFTRSTNSRSPVGNGPLGRKLREQPLVAWYSWYSPRTGAFNRTEVAEKGHPVHIQSCWTYVDSYVASKIERVTAWGD